MQTTPLLLATMALFTTALASYAPAPVGVEVVRRDGETIVREVPRSLAKRSCTNCVHVGDRCTIGEGNCYASENAYCTDCENGNIICVDIDGGSCTAP